MIALDPALRRHQGWTMTSVNRNRRRRVLVPQALGSDEFLRTTWHETRDVVVFSQWSRDECIAAIPVRVGDLPELAELLDDAITGDPVADWPAPLASDLIVPAAGLTVPAERRIA